MYSYCTICRANVVRAGRICERHREIFNRNSFFAGKKLVEPREIVPLESRHRRTSAQAMTVLKVCVCVRVRGWLAGPPPASSEPVHVRASCSPESNPSRRTRATGRERFALSSAPF